MKNMKRKIGVALILAATPGLSVMNCGGMAGREFRDAAIAGGADYIELRTFELFDQWFPVLRDDEG